MSHTPFEPVQGFIPSAAGVIFTTHGVVGDYVRSFDLFNEGAGTETVLVDIGARRWHRVVLLPNESVHFLSEGESLVFDAGTTITASTTTANSVSFTITGVSES